MGKSTGPILAAGSIAWANNVLLNEQPKDLFTASAKVGIGTGLAAMTLSLIERASTDLAVMFAWAAVVTVLFVRVNKKTPTPLERAFSIAGI